MGTKCMLAMELLSYGKCSGYLCVHVQFDGDPESILPILKGKYMEYRDVLALLMGGDMSSIQFSEKNGKDSPCYYSESGRYSPAVFFDKLSEAVQHFGCKRDSEYYYLFSKKWQEIKFKDWVKF